MMRMCLFNLTALGCALGVLLGVLLVDGAFINFRGDQVRRAIEQLDGCGV
jgi:hypothetical protein